VDGVQGPVGGDGAQGPAGEQGEQGEQGAQGEQGPAGEAGAAGSGDGGGGSMGCPEDGVWVDMGEYCIEKNKRPVADAPSEGKALNAMVACNIAGGHICSASEWYVACQRSYNISGDSLAGAITDMGDLQGSHSKSFAEYIDVDTKNNSDRGAGYDSSGVVGPAGTCQRWIDANSADNVMSTRCCSGKVVLTGGGGDGDVTDVVPSGPPAVRIFVTSSTYFADLGGMAGADSRCQDHADSVGFEGTWKALLSVAGTDAVDRISDGDYYNMNGDMIVSSKANLFPQTGNYGPTTLDSSVLYDEYGNSVGGAAFTASWANGRLDPAEDCEGFNNAPPCCSSASWCRIGYSDATDYNWFFSSGNTGDAYRLYCFEDIGG